MGKLTHPLDRCILCLSVRPIKSPYLSKRWTDKQLYRSKRQTDSVYAIDRESAPRIACPSILPEGRSTRQLFGRARASLKQEVALEET